MKRWTSPKPGPSVRILLPTVHVNPCFYRANHKSKFVPLEMNEWCWLHSGDCLSLLPDKYAFRVIAEDSLQEVATQRNSQPLDEDCALRNDSPCSPTHSGTKDEEDGPSCSGTNNSNAASLSRLAQCSKKEEPSSLRDKTDERQSQPAQRKRNLPSWMLQGDLPIQGLPSSVIKSGKKRRNVTANRFQKPVESVTEKKPTPTRKSKEDEEGSKKKSKAALRSEVSPGSSLDIDTATAGPPENVADNDIEMEEEAEECTPDLSPTIELEDEDMPSGSASTRPCKPSSSRPAQNEDPELPKITQQAPKPQNAQQAPNRRVPCMYAENCYRKNPVHFEEFSHPGDSDYHVAESGSQDDADDRPECPYGIDCYRKNPQHKLEYKHTQPPGRRLRKRNKKKGKSVLDNTSDDDGEANDYDLEDSFIDDEEEEDYTDEDSDWMPDSQEKDSEDIKDLLHEAKKFVKGKH
ncbi:aprataxin and PNK-like factor isoform X2 [Hyperolius riggenbachi]|uniref:aprataxin and PNK-like factor isoform X2 n=1 Tax=Hyperolius riggenbachi TaxID=752182 RepID=UPI0035A3CBA7